VEGKCDTHRKLVITTCVESLEFIETTVTVTGGEAIEEMWR
jgi:hypothetical protein